MPSPNRSRPASVDLSNPSKRPRSEQCAELSTPREPSPGDDTIIDDDTEAMDPKKDRRFSPNDKSVDVPPGHAAYQLVATAESIVEWRHRMFELRETIQLTVEQKEVIWPYVDNFWERRGGHTEIRPTLGTATWNYRCRNSRKQSAPRGTGKRNKPIRPVHEQCGCRIRITARYQAKPDDNLFGEVAWWTFTRSRVSTDHLPMCSIDQLDRLKRSSQVKAMAAAEMSKGYQGKEVFDRLQYPNDAKARAEFAAMGGSQLKLSDVHNAARVIKAQQAVDGEKEKHIVIIGGGIIGCSSAYFVTRHPKFDSTRHKVTVLESTKIAGGASGKAGGLLALWAYPKPLVDLSYKLHQELSDEHGGTTRWDYRAVHCGELACTVNSGDSRPRKSKMDKAPPRPGTHDDAHVSLQKRSGEVLARMRSAGVPGDLDWVDSAVVGSYDQMGDPSNTAQVHPFQFTTSMAELAQEGGAEIRVGARAKELLYTDDGQQIRGVLYEDEHGTRLLEATDIIISAGPWTSLVYPPAPITPLRAHSVTIEPTRPVSAYALFTQIKLPISSTGNHADEARRVRSRGSHIVTPEIYARRREVYACGEGDRLVPLPASTDLVEVDEQRCQDVVDYVSSISEELKGGEVTARQACYLPNVSRGSGHPLVGRTNVRGLFLCAGHTCWGIQNGPGSGKLMSEFVFDGRPVSAKIDELDPRLVL